MDRFKRIFKKDGGAGSVPPTPNSSAPSTPKQQQLDFDEGGGGGGRTNSGLSSQSRASPPSSASYVMMDATLQKRLQGLRQHLKIIIRGAQKTGKTALFHRLQGHDIPKSYDRTPQIQVANFPWSSTPTQAPDTKVEVWDVVDQGTLELVPDASNVDVYRYTHLVIFMVDVTRRETLDYVRREGSKVPTSVAILVVANFYDVAVRIQVSEAEIAELCEQLPKATSRLCPNKLTPCYLHTSMTTCLGLKSLHSFLRIPCDLARIRTFETQAESLWDYVERDRQEFQLSNSSVAAPPSSGVESSAIGGPPKRTISSYNNDRSDGSSSLHPPMDEATASLGLKGYSYGVSGGGGGGGGAHDSGSDFSDDDLPAAMRQVNANFFEDDDDDEHEHNQKSKKSSSRRLVEIEDKEDIVYYAKTPSEASPVPSRPRSPTTTATKVSVEAPLPGDVLAALAQAQGALEAELDENGKPKKSKKSKSSKSHHHQKGDDDAGGADGIAARKEKKERREKKEKKEKRVKAGVDE